MGLDSMVFVIVLLLWCIFWVLAESYCFWGFVMVLIINRKFTGALFRTVKCTMPNLDEVG